ncbi:MAG: DNA gyrase inhibitor YacG [Alphaproteobacteria bacterium]
MASCPICGKEPQKPYTPFCCKRCADIDLGRWFTGSYSVPVVEMDDLPVDELPDDEAQKH